MFMFLFFFFLNRTPIEMYDCVTPRKTSAKKLRSEDLLFWANGMIITTYETVLWDFRVERAALLPGDDLKTELCGESRGKCATAREQKTLKDNGRCVQI